MSKCGNATFLAPLCDLCNSAEEKNDRRVSLQVQKALRIAQLEGAPFPNPGACLLEEPPFVNCPNLTCDCDIGD